MRPSAGTWSAAPTDPAGHFHPAPVILLTCPAGARLVSIGQEEHMLRWLHCLFRGYHSPERQLVGGFRCSECRLAGADLEDMGFENFGYAPSLRRALVRREVFRG